MLVINIETLSNIGRKITGEIYFEFSNFIFPEKGWNDFVVIILSWWLNEFKKNNYNFKMLFMDGSFEIEIKESRNKQIDMVFFKGDTKLFTINTSKNTLKTELLKSARKVLRKAYQKNWQTSDVEGLKKIISLYHSSK